MGGRCRRPHLSANGSDQEGTCLGYDNMKTISLVMIIASNCVGAVQHPASRRFSNIRHMNVNTKGISATCKCVPCNCSEVLDKLTMHDALYCLRHFSDLRPTHATHFSHWQKIQCYLPRQMILKSCSVSRPICAVTKYRIVFQLRFACSEQASNCKGFFFRNKKNYSVPECNE